MGAAGGWGLSASTSVSAAGGQGTGGATAASGAGVGEKHSWMGLGAMGGGVGAGPCAAAAKGWGPGGGAGTGAATAVAGEPTRGEGMRGSGKGRPVRGDGLAAGAVLALPGRYCWDRAEPGGEGAGLLPCPRREASRPLPMPGRSARRIGWAVLELGDMRSDLRHGVSRQREREAGQGETS